MCAGNSETDPSKPMSVKYDLKEKSENKILKDITLLIVYNYTRTDTWAILFTSHILFFPITWYTITFYFLFILVSTCLNQA